MPDPANDNADPKPGRPGPGRAGCPVCGKPVNHAARPFCSPRCADVDLHRWLGEAYVASGPGIARSG